MSELADRAVNSRSRLTHTVTRMEERGLVRREACPDDGRGVLCLLTDAGFAALERAAPDHVAARPQDRVRRPCADGGRGLGVALQKIRDGLRARLTASCSARDLDAGRRLSGLATPLVSSGLRSRAFP